MTRPITRSDRRALSDAMRHMMAGGIAPRDVRLGLNLSIRQLPRDVYLASGLAKGRPRGGRA